MLISIACDLFATYLGSRIWELRLSGALPGSGSGSKLISYCHLTARRHIAYKLNDYAASSTIDMGKCEAEKTEQFILQNYLRA